MSRERERRKLASPRTDAEARDSKNFKSNLIRFTNEEDPVKYAGAIGSAPNALPFGGPAKDADYSRLLDDLITENARGSMMNRYQPGSISDPIVAYQRNTYATK